MRLATIFTPFVLALAQVASAVAAEPVEIPLKEIWSHRSGGKSLQEFEPEVFPKLVTKEDFENYAAFSRTHVEEIKRLYENSLVMQLGRSMGRLIAKGDATPPPGFAVEGIGKDAFVRVHDILVNKKPAPETFKSTSELSAVFFSLGAQPYLNVQKVERAGNVVKVFYSLKAHGHLDVSWELALIPLGKLESGEYRVEPVRVPSTDDQKDFPPVEANLERVIVCRPYRFTVE